MQWRRQARSRLSRGLAFVSVLTLYSMNGTRVTVLYADSAEMKAWEVSDMCELFLPKMRFLFSTLGLLTCGSLHAETVCTNPNDDPPGPGTTVACYSDAGCAIAQAFGAEPIRDYDLESAPFALARGKISAIVTSDADVIRIAKTNGAICRAQKK